MSIPESIKYFHESSFDDFGKRKEITGPIPDRNSYEKAYKKIEKIRANKINPEMLPCYQKPLLNYEQERHLFRKMNFFKYQAKKLIDSSCKMKQRLAVYVWNKAVEVRNQIAESNFRLATQIIKHQNKNNSEYSSTEMILSDAYFDVLKAVDYFNYTLGHRFSTYATWVIKKNYFREIKNKGAQSDKVVFLDESCAEAIEDRSNNNMENETLSQKNLIKKLVCMLVRENLGTDRVRQAYVLEKYFGVNGKHKMTLEQISEDIGVTKERVRQLKEKGLEWIRYKVLELGISIDD